MCLDEIHEKRKTSRQKGRVLRVHAVAFAETAAHDGHEATKGKVEREMSRGDHDTSRCVKQISSPLSRTTAPRPLCLYRPWQRFAGTMPVIHLDFAALSILRVSARADRASARKIVDALPLRFATEMSLTNAAPLAKFRSSIVLACLPFDSCAVSRVSRKFVRCIFV